MRFIRLAVIWSILLLICVISVSAQGLKDIGYYDVWMGVYLGSNRIGYMHESLRPDKFEGKDVYCFERIIKLRAVANGASREVTASNIDYVTEKFSPVYGASEESISGKSSRTVKVEARYGAATIQCKTTSDGKTVSRTVRIPRGVNLAELIKYLLHAKKLNVGDKLKLDNFDLDKLTILKETIAAPRRETIEVGGKTYNTLLVTVDDASETISTWELDNGEPVKIEMHKTGLTLLRETQEENLANNNQQTQDLGIVNSDCVISAPWLLKELDVKLEGMPDTVDLITDDRQTVTYDSKEHSARYRINAQRFDPSKDIKRPVHGKQYIHYLASTNGIETNNPAILKLSRQIVGNETSAYKAACKIRAWINANVTYQVDVDINESAIATLKAREGVCRHFAVLYAALARAAGIPTRLAAGLSGGQGHFGFHMWAESFVGKWTPFDATLPSDFVDAGHIKLVQGNLDDVQDMARIAGRLKAAVKWWVPWHEWMGVFAGEKKIGYTHLSLDRAWFESKTLYKMDYVTNYPRPAGRNALEKTTSTLYYDDNNKPVCLFYNETCQGCSKEVEARFESGMIECRITNNDQTSTRSIPIPAGADLVKGVAFDTGDVDLSVGQKLTLSRFCPQCLAVETSTIRVDRKEIVHDEDGNRDCLVIREPGHNGDALVWQMTEGGIVRAEIPGGLVKRWMTREEALDDKPEQALESLALPLDKEIKDVKRLRELKLKLIGVPQDKGMIRNDLRITCARVPDENSIEYRVMARGFTPAKSLHLPISAAGYRQYLWSSADIQAGDQSIRKLAKQIIGKETSAFYAACKLRAWVYTNILFDTNSEINETALDTLQARAGSNKHRALLYAALARAAGIPTRLAAGLYCDDESLRCYIWAESFVGEWVPVNPMVPANSMSARYIKLAEGDNAWDELDWLAHDVKAEVVGYK